MKLFPKKINSCDDVDDHKFILNKLTKSTDKSLSISENNFADSTVSDNI